jgi:hypothetical protein
MRAHRRILLLALALSTAVPVTAFAQVTVEVGALFGAYAPVGSFAPADFGTTTLPRQPSDLRGLAWGGDARVWLTQNVGVQIQTVVASSRIPGVFVPAGFLTPATYAHVLAVTAQALYRPAPRIVPLVLSAGYGVVRYGGSAYAGMQNLSSMAAVLGVGLDLHLARRWAATFGVTALLYTQDVQDPGVTDNGSSVERGFRTDFLPHVTLTWRVL